MPKEQKLELAFNREGWYCIRHDEGWMIGTQEGVFCFETMETAKLALTIVWQRDGGGQLKFRIDTFKGPVKKRPDDYTPQLTAEEALKRYEGKGN